jgi:protein subunit release factor A
VQKRHRAIRKRPPLKLIAKHIDRLPELKDHQLDERMQHDPRNGKRRHASQHILDDAEILFNNTKLFFSHLYYNLNSLRYSNKTKKQQQQQPNSFRTFRIVARQTMFRRFHSKISSSAETIVKRAESLLQQQQQKQSRSTLESSKSSMKPSSLTKDLQALERLLQQFRGSSLVADADSRSKLLTELNDASTLVEDSILFDGGGDGGGDDCFLEITAGVGGEDSNDWTRMLRKMYVAWATRGKRTVTLIDETPSSNTIRISKRRAFSMLRFERGVHRLVRVSPFDPAARRHTSFASVLVLPAEVVLENDDYSKKAALFSPSDVKIETFRFDCWCVWFVCVCDWGGRTRVDRAEQADSR